MAGIARKLTLAVAEGLADEICELCGDVEQAALAGRVIVGNGGLDEMACAVELVALGEVLPAKLGMADREICIQVAVRLLGLPMISMSSSAWGMYSVSPLFAQ